MATLEKFLQPGNLAAANKQDMEQLKVRQQSGWVVVVIWAVVVCNANEGSVCM